MGIIKSAGIKKTESEGVADVVRLYRAMVDAMRTADKPGFDRVRYSRLEIKIDALWPKLTDEEHVQAVDNLVESGHMRPNVAMALTMSRGRIDKWPGK